MSIGTSSTTSFVGTTTLFNTAVRSGARNLIGTSCFITARNYAEISHQIQAVCQILLPLNAEGKKEHATGFLIGRGLIMTNNHVIPDINTAAHKDCKARFFYEEGRESFEVNFNPDADNKGFFLSSEQPGNKSHNPLTPDKLDFTIIAIKPHPKIDAIYDSYISIFERALPKVMDYANIIHHPTLNEKQKLALNIHEPFKIVTLRENRVKVIDSNGLAIHYTAKTMGGSSGAPVLNDHGHLYGLHYSKCGTHLDLECNRAVSILAIANRIAHETRKKIEEWNAINPLLLPDGIFQDVLAFGEELFEQATKLSQNFKISGTEADFILALDSWKTIYKFYSDNLDALDESYELNSLTQNNYQDSKEILEKQLGLVERQILHIKYLHRLFSCVETNPHHINSNLLIFEKHLLRMGISKNTATNPYALPLLNLKSFPPIEHFLKAFISEALKNYEEAAQAYEAIADYYKQLPNAEEFQERIKNCTGCALELKAKAIEDTRRPLVQASAQHSILKKDLKVATYCPKRLNIPPEILNSLKREDVNLDKLFETSSFISLVQADDTVCPAGKTATALNYVHTTTRYEKIFWFDAQTPESLAKSLEIVMVNGDCSLEQFIEQATQSSNILIVYDNVNESTSLQAYLPPFTSYKGHLLIISRNLPLAGSLIVKVGGFSPSFVKALLTPFILQQDDEKVIDGIIQTYEGAPSKIVELYNCLSDKEISLESFEEYVVQKKQMQQNTLCKKSNLTHFDRFVGRVQELESVYSELQKKNKLYITGNPETGKTSFAIEYAMRYSSKYTYIGYINCSTQETILTSYQTLAEKIKVDSTADKQLIQRVNQKLKDFTSLLIFDEVASEDAINNLIPNNQSHLLIIFQNPRLTPIKSFYLPPLDKPKTVLLFQQLQEGLHDNFKTKLVQSLHESEESPWGIRTLVNLLKQNVDVNRELNAPSFDHMINQLWSSKKIQRCIELKLDSMKKGDLYDKVLTVLNFLSLRKDKCFMEVDIERCLDKLEVSSTNKVSANEILKVIQDIFPCTVCGAFAYLYRLSNSLKASIKACISENEKNRLEPIISLIDRNKGIKS
jgi:hypothetical protein